MFLTITRLLKIGTVLQSESCILLSEGKPATTPKKVVKKIVKKKPVQKKVEPEEKEAEPGMSYLVRKMSCVFHKTNKMACVPSEDSAHLGPLPGLIKVFAVRSMGS